MNIIIIDDDPENIQILSDILTGCGYKVLPVQSGKIALKIIQSENPDMILFDANMTEMNSYGICKRLKSERKFKDVPVIFISPTYEGLNRKEIFNSGGVDYITRPFQCEEVKMRINTHLELRKLHMKEDECAAKEFLYNEEGQKLLFDKLQIGILVLNINAKIIFHNTKSFQLLGLSGDQYDGKFSIDDVRVFNPEDSPVPFNEFLVNNLTSGRPQLVNYIVGVNKPLDGDKSWLLVNTFTEHDSDNKSERIIVTMLDITERKKAEEALKDSQDQLKQFVVHLNTAREEEKVALARELHDNIGQMLIAIKIDLGLLKQKFTVENQNKNSIEISEDIQSIYAHVDNTIKVIRKLLTELWT